MRADWRRVGRRSGREPDFVPDWAQDWGRLGGVPDLPAGLDLLAAPAPGRQAAAPRPGSGRASAPGSRTSRAKSRLSAFRRLGTRLKGRARAVPPATRVSEKIQPGE